MSDSEHNDDFEVYEFKKENAFHYDADLQLNKYMQAIESAQWDVKDQRYRSCRKI